MIMDKTLLWPIEGLIPAVVVITIVILLLLMFRAWCRCRRMVQMLTSKNEELLRLSRELDETTQAKIDFFTRVSHEFRTPLTLIAGLTDELRRGELSHSQRRQIEIVHRNTDILLQLINRLLEIRRAESYPLMLSMQEFDFVASLKDWCSGFECLARKKNIVWEWDVQDEVLPVKADRTRLAEVLYNLLSNAIKYTPSGGRITMQLTCEDTHFVRLRIKDTGIGIPPEAQQHLFTDFFRVRNGEVGTGLGLVATKLNVEAHGGSIEVNSQLGEGTEFVVRLPIRIEHGRVESGESSESISSESPLSAEYVSVYKDITDASDTSLPMVLVIDDNPDICYYIRMMLDGKYQVICAPDGEVGIRKAQSYIPDLIICDIMMPVMDGNECCKRLKANFRTSHIPIIMLTACSLDEQKIEGYDVGADAYILKPFNRDMLMSRIRNLLAGRARLQQYFTDMTQTSATHAQGSETKEIKPVSMDKAFLQQFNELLQKHLSDPEMNVDEMSEQLGLSRVQLYRKVKALTNHSPAELLKNIRLKRAYLLIETTDKSISEIAYEVGFTSPSYFARCFREEYDVAPGEVVRKR